MNATGDHSNVTASTINVAGSVGLTAGITIRHAQDDRTTEADTTASATAGVGLSTTGAVSVTADATNTATAHDLAPDIAIGGVAISVVYGLAEVGGATRVKLDGNVTLSTSITATAYGDNTANAPVVQLEASIGGAGGVFSDAEITGGVLPDGTHLGAAIEALVGSDASLNTSGAICVDAETAAAGTKAKAGDPCPEAANLVKNTATANVLSVTFGLALSISAMVSQTGINADVEATLDGTVTGSASISVKANGSNDATSTTTTANLGTFAIGGAGANADIGKDAVTQASAGSSSSLTSAGAIQFTATSNNAANAASDGGTGGLVAIGINFPSATVAGATIASIGGDVSADPPGVMVGASADERQQREGDVVRRRGRARSRNRLERGRPRSPAMRPRSRARASSHRARAPAAGHGPCPATASRSAPRQPTGATPRRWASGSAWSP